MRKGWRSGQRQITWYLRVLVKNAELYLKNTKKPWKNCRQGSNVFIFLILKDYLVTDWNESNGLCECKEKRYEECCWVD